MRRWNAPPSPAMPERLAQACLAGFAPAALVPVVALAIRQALAEAARVARGGAWEDDTTSAGDENRKVAEGASIQTANGIATAIERLAALGMIERAPDMMPCVKGDWPDRAETENATAYPWWPLLKPDDWCGESSR